MDEAILETTIEQHAGDHPTGGRIRELVTIRTSWLDDADEGPWETLSAKDQAYWWDYVRELHDARVALASLDCDERAAAQEWLLEHDDYDMETCADALRKACDVARHA